MSLRRQLLLVSLLLLSLPWAGCQFVREIEGALRQGQEQSLQATARAIATVLQDRPELLYPYPQRMALTTAGERSLYAAPAQETVMMDGYADGWAEQDYGRFENDSGLTLSYQALIRDDRLYLLLRIRDPEVVYHNPGLSPEPNGDRVVLRTWQQQRRQDYVISTAAPGRVRGQFGNPRDRGADASRLGGYWQDTADGYSLELEVPLAMTGGRLGVYVLDVNKREGSAVHTAGNASPLDSSAPPWLIYRSPALQRALAPFGERSASLQVVDRFGWLVADPPKTVSTLSNDSNSDTFWLLRLLYRSALKQEDRSVLPVSPHFGKLAGAEIESALAGESRSQWYRSAQDSARASVSAATPITINGQVAGAVVTRESSEQYLSLTDQAFSSLLGYSVLALGSAALGLLGYASLLSWRIRRLSQAAEQAVADNGEVLDNFPRSKARDEVGELSRNYAQLLGQVREYNDYLRTLSRKLSHELRTPIAVIQGSLDNLEQTAQGSAENSIYLRRARQGLARLNRILTAMSEASRLEESIRSNPLQPLDLVPLLREVFAAYRELYADHRLLLTIEPNRAETLAAAELVVQALDKLMDNAASFCPDSGDITVSLGVSGDHWALSVSNAGPPLPAALAGRLFEPMVSLRKDQGDVHLGLGLHVVRLIAEYLQGQIHATNLPDNSGVRFTLSLPRAG